MHPKTLTINTHHLVLMANVKDAPFKCLSCKKVFISENHLKRHEDRRHNTKNTSIPSERVKEGTINGTTDDLTIKAVLNATERIEDLLVKLAIRDNEKNPNIPLALSSPRSNFDYSLVTSSSFTSDKNDQNLQFSKYTANDSISNKRQKEKFEVEYYKKRLFQDSLVNSNSIKSEKDERNIENCEHLSNECKSIKYNNNPMTYSSPRSNFDYSQVASSSFSRDKNEQIFFENCKYISSESTSDEKPNGIAMKEKSSLKDDTLISTSCKNEENGEYNSNEIASNKESKTARSKSDQMSNLKYDSVISNLFTTGENGENIENCDHSSKESIYNKKLKEASMLKTTEKKLFKDAPVISNSITTDKIEKDLLVASDSITVEKSEQIMGSYDLISDDSISNKEQTDIANLKFNETSDFGDAHVACNSFTQEKSEQNMESSELITFNSIPLKKSKGITKMTCSDYLEEQENKAIWRLTSSVIKSSNFSLEVLDQRHFGSDLGSVKNYSLTSPDDYIESRPVIQCRSSIKSEILKKLDRKLESYGIDTSQNTLSDKDMRRIGNLLKEERDRIAEEIPDYHKLRQLIKDSAHRRIEENLRTHCFYVS